MSRRILFIVFSDDWGIHMSSAQHLFRRIARRHRVAWINTIGMRGPSLTWADVRKARRKLSGMLRKSKHDFTTVDDAPVSVHQPAMFPWNNLAVLRQFNRRSVRRAMYDATSESDFDLVVVVSTVPNACDYIDVLPAAHIVYYCVDDFSEWPGLDREKILAMERVLLSKTDFCIATSTRLLSRLSASGISIRRLDHGVDLNLFMTEAAREHSVLADIPEKRIGFFGLFDDRFDKALISTLAKRMPDISIVLAGQLETDVTDLQRIDNIHFVGPIAYGELPQFIHGMRALIMPYQVNELARSLSPLKLKEYLATGRPVIGTPIPAICEFGERIVTASNVDEWERAVRCAMLEDIDQRRMKEAAMLATESWDAKAAEFERLVVESVQGPASSMNGNGVRLR